MKSPLVSIVILNFNKSRDTIKCVNSLHKINYNNYNIIIIDNASTDDSEKEIKVFLNNNINNRNNISFIKSDFNGGYAYGNNIGINYAIKSGADYLLLLNNDTIVDPNFLDPLVQMCESNNNIGIVSGKINTYANPKLIWYNGGSYNRWTGTVKHYNYFEIEHKGVINNQTTFISGCMMFIPSHTLRKVGLLDESYFMYIEDLEYSQRVLSNGYTLQVNEDSKVYHKVSSEKKDAYNKFSVYWKVRNTNYFLLFSAKYLHQLIISEIIFNLKMAYRLIVMSKFSLLATILRGIKDSYKMMANSIN